VDQRDLVIRAQGGDHDAFTNLAAAAIARLDAAARLILRDGELARDAVQDTLVRAWRDLPGLRDPERFDPWLHRLTVNACLDLARRRRRRSIEVQLTPIAIPSVADTAPDIAERQQLDDALERLEPGWRAIVVMHFYLGMPMPDIAVALRIPLGTAKSRLHRALREMRVTLAEPEPSDDVIERVPGGQPA
jgi:RNA polymerase sigma-70 factor (ECF subfamily)